MARWKYNKNRDDEYFRYDKIRRGKDKRKKKQDGEEKFVLDEVQWKKEDGWFRARVVEVQKRYAFVAPQDDDGTIDTKDVWLGTVARKYLQSKRMERNSVAVGDVVLCRPTDDREADIETDIPCCVIVNLAPRHSEISRRDPTSQERSHVLASNVDQLLVVASYQSPLVKWGLVDRYLVLAEEQGIEPIIVLNKEDLLKEESEEFRQRCREEIETYRRLGYRIFSLSVLTNSKDPAITEIGELMKDKVTILSGHSGVGKSSLVNMYRPEIVQEVEPDADIFYKGRHTTTYASFIGLDTGGYVIDTPGIRSFLLGDRSSIDLSYSFREFRPYMGACKFRECRHIDEPGCAILDALQKGEITNRRYRSYKGLLLGDTGREGRTRDDELEKG
ncbi:ribosome small subunit-dependent GTPase A [Pseudobacteriovorax antillogorgiicola]|uniref:Small ribosomal subunit biogenesis GTPase RsgA n=1 Tax=Pseudobacteriovorax antillogorgiicola TaxID=1513793 RepID=A0A1Y6CB59_9BACT|nr:ribosome small subunit-dependent GTPase A [Pseudobacteriovorax antillogorgiicola]TCS49482.1 ribosome biogenesis GTPase [Pseudobacteriovorax antillogorgiicola]SMF46094.1 ribosome biogenesis GTPase [Pseudobacteriovorax antillogorgiicola]